MVDISLAIDTGNSGTKIIYSFPQSNRVNYMFMSSAVEEVSKQRLEVNLRQNNWLRLGEAKERAWLSLGNNFLVVGAFAEAFSPRDKRALPKYEEALYKVLAAIGAIADSRGFSRRKKLKIHLGLLLPWNEFQDRERMLLRLKELAEDFEFCGRKLRVSIEKWVCYPEGGGVAMSRINTLGMEWFVKHQVGILMLGDRNWSGIYFKNGTIADGESPREGFSYFLDRVIESAPCLLRREQLEKAIFQSINRRGKTSWENLEAIKSLATARDAKLRKSEIQDIADAISLFSREWEEKLFRFLDRIFPSSLNELNVCGGAFPFFESLIRDWSNCSRQGSPIDIQKGIFIKTVVNGDMTSMVEKSFNFSADEISLAFPSRFIDVFGLHLYLKNQVEPKKGKLVTG